jgi:hypothetical protein
VSWAAVLTDDELRAHVADFAPRGGIRSDCEACPEAISRGLVRRDPELADLTRRGQR